MLIRCEYQCCKNNFSLNEDLYLSSAKILLKTITMKDTVDQIGAKIVLAPVIKERMHHLLIKSLIPITYEVSVTS